MKWRPRYSLLTLLLAAFCAGCILLLWRNGAAWRIDRFIPDGNPTPSPARHFSRDMHWMLSVAVEREKAPAKYDATLWNLDTGVAAGSIALGYGLDRVQLSGDGQYVAILIKKPQGISVDYEVRIVRAATGQLLANVPIKCERYSDLIFCADNKSLIVENNWIRFIPSIEVVSWGETNHITGCFFDPEAQRKHDAEIARKTKLTADAKTLREFSANSRELYVRSYASPSGKILLTQVGFNDSPSTIWDLNTGQKLYDTVLHLDEFGTAHFVGDDKLAFEKTDGTLKDARYVRIVELTTGTELMRSFDYSLRYSTGSDVDYSRDGQRLIVSDRNESNTSAARIWDVKQGLLDFKYGGESVNFGNISPKGTRFAIGNQVESNFSVRIYDVNTSKLLIDLPDPDNQDDGEFRFGPNDDTLNYYNNSGFYIYHRHHPEPWWGLACTLEFWFAAVSFLALAASIFRDRRVLA